MDPNPLLQSIQRMQAQSETMMRWFIGIMLVMALIQLVTMLIFIVRAGELMKSGAKYLDTKAVLMMAQFEGKRFVDERAGPAKSGSGDDSKYQPKI